MNNINIVYNIIIDLLLLCSSAHMQHPAITKAEKYLSNTPEFIVEKILIIVKKYYKITQEQLNSNDRKPVVVSGRRAYFNLATTYTSLSPEDIALKIHKERTTSLNAIKVMNNFQDTNDKEWFEYKRVRDIFLLSINREPETNEEKKDL